MGPRRKILLVGAGGREHALGWRLRRSPSCGELLAAPGNPGLAALPGVRTLPIAPTELPRLCEAARREDVDLVIIGPEAPLQAGLADALRAERGERTAVFGPSARAAELEASKVFAKAFMNRHGIATAAHAVVRSAAEAEAFLAVQGAAGRHAFVVKADGLHGGKGVTVCATLDEALAAARAAVAGGEAAVIEERLSGREASCLALCDGEELWPLPPCEDHKTIFEGDQGPMTGGMGVVCPTPVLDDRLLRRVVDEVLRPAARGMVEEGRPFQGLLYAGVMVTSDGPRVLEFNCRFGDPETQPLMALWDGDLVAALEAVGRGELGRTWSDGALRASALAREAAVCVVLSAAGYPGAARRGDVIGGLAEAEAVAPGRIQVFHAGTALDGAGRLVTAGGRVLSVTARAGDLAAARALAYRAAAELRFDGAYYRRDIGGRT